MFHLSTTDFGVNGQILVLMDKQKRVEEAVSVGLNQMNLYFCVLVKIPLRDTRNVSTQKKGTSSHGSKSWFPPNWCLVCVLAKTLLGDIRLSQNLW